MSVNATMSTTSVATIATTATTALAQKETITIAKCAIGKTENTLILCFDVYKINPDINTEPLKRYPDEENMPLPIKVDVDISFEPSYPFGENTPPGKQKGTYYFPEKAMQVMFPKNSSLVIGTFYFSFCIGKTLYKIQKKYDEKKDYYSESDSESDSDSDE